MVEKKMVMIPGPTPVVKSIQDEMGREVQAFGDPRFVNTYKQLIADLGKLLNCSGMTFPLAGTGTAAMEMAIANSTKAGDNILIISHGYFGDRFIEIAERKRLNVDVMQAEWGKIIPVADIEAKLTSKHYSAMTVSHVDTATGVVAPIVEIGEMMKKFPDTVFILDGVAATGGEYCDVDGMGIDILFTASQKAFGVSPGMFILWAGKKAFARRKTLGTIPEYYLDFDKWIPIMENPAKYFATPAVNLVWALAEATRIISVEGYRARAERHTQNAHAVRRALTTIGFKVLAEEGHRATTLSNLLYPEGLDDAKFRNALYDEGVVVAGGLAQYTGKMFRLGHMGNIDINDQVAVLGAIERAMAIAGYKVEFGSAVGAYLNYMWQFR